MSVNGLFSCESNVVVNQINEEIHLQLNNLQVYSVQLLSIIVKPFSDSFDEIIDLLKSFLDYGIFIYHDSNVAFKHILQAQSQIVKLIYPYLNNNNARYCQLVIAETILCKLAPFISKKSGIINDIFCSLYFGDEFNGGDLPDLQDAITKEPYLSKILLDILNYDISSADIYSLCFLKSSDIYPNNPDTLPNMLFIIGQCSTLNESVQKSINKLLSISKDKCLLKHITMELGLKQTPEERYRLSYFLKTIIVDDLLKSFDVRAGAVTDNEEKLCNCLVVNSTFPLTHDHSQFYDLGWLTLVTSQRGPIKILLSLINNLIEAQCMDELRTLLKSKSMVLFNQLLLINLWRPDLANVTTMQVLLDTCYPVKCSDSQINYIEQLCLKIRTRWNTLKKFNSRLSYINKDQPTFSNDIIALTTMSNTSHLELIAGLSDPTRFEENVILDLLERTGRVYNDSIFDEISIHLESEILEESCDKAMYYCAVSIRKVWECLVLFSSIDTRQLIVDHQYPNHTFELIEPEDSFYFRFRSALQDNDLLLSEQIYQQSIITRLTYLKTHINMINPLSLRLELLENIYSLLFITEYDLFNAMVTNMNHQSNAKNYWQLPETIKTNNTRSKSNTSITDKVPNLDKNRFICSFFLCKDLLVCLEHHLRGISTQIDVTYVQIPAMKDMDNKMASYINYPLYLELKIRLIRLSKLLEDLHWRIDLLTTNQLDFSYDAIGIIDMPINVIFDSNSRQLSDIFRPRINQKIRPRSQTLTRKHPGKILQRKTVAAQKDLPNIRNNTEKSSSPIDDTDKLTSAPQQNLIKEQNLFTNIGESSAKSSNDENLNEIDTFPNINDEPKMNCQFIMESISWIIEPIEYLAMTALVCGYKDKANQIAKIYSDARSNNPLLNDLLTEIRYQGWFDKFVDQLGKIVTPIEEEKTSEISNKKFGHFDWKKLSDLSAKISSNKENEIAEIVNHLLTLNGQDRPFLKASRSTDSHSDITYSNKIKDFNSGLLFDLALQGSISKWQLLQMLYQIESHQSTDLAPVENKTECLGYHKLPGLTSFVDTLRNSITLDKDQDNETYTNLEMKGAVEIRYYTSIQKWLNKLQIFVKLLHFNIGDSVEFQSNNPDTETRWNYLNNLTCFLNATLSSPNDSTVPYGYLIRNVLQYLESLQSHLEVFAKFLNDHKQSQEISSNNQSPKTRSYLLHEFSVLKRSPSEVLGELIFLKFVDPLCNEIRQISQDLGLNISEVILQNCLPSINSCSDEAKQDSDSSLSTSTNHQNVIHNQPEGVIIRREYNLHPIEIVMSCLETIIRLLLKISYKSTSSSNLTNMEQSMTETTFKTIHKVRSKPVSTYSSSSNVSIEAVSNSSVPIKMIDCDQKILSEVCEEEEWIKMLMIDIVDLNNVDMNQITTNEERSAFFINLHNLMMMHMIVLNIQNGELTLKYRSFKSRLLRESFCYNVGKLGIVSICQISQYYLNIPDITFFDLDDNQDEIALPFPLDMEQRYRNVCPFLQTLTIFGMIDGTISGPSLKVYKPETIAMDLQNNLSHIIKYQSTCDPDKRQICLPQIFKWYNKLIHINMKSGISSSRTDDNIFQRILSNCNEQIFREYSQLLRVDSESISYNISEQFYPKSIKVIWQSRRETIGCTLIEKKQDLSDNNNKLSRKTPHGSSSSLSDSLSISTNNHSNDLPVTKYYPTVAVIDHLRTLNPILACLVYSIIGDDFISSPHNSDEKLDVKRISQEQVDEIHSYKYSRLQNDYSPIGNWIIHYWSPWFHTNKFSQTAQLNLASYAEALLIFCKDHIPIEIRWAAFSHPLAKNLDKVLIDYAIQFMNRNSNGYFMIACAIRNLHSKTIDNSIELQSLLDMLMVKSAHYWATGLMEKIQIHKTMPPDHVSMQDECIKYQEARLLDCIYAMKNNNLRLSESYRYYELLSIPNVVTLMEANSVSQYPNNEKIKEQLKVLRIFKRIHDLVAFCQSKDEIWFKAHLPTEFLHWQHLRNVSENSPDQVFKFLIQQKQFDLSRKWCQIFMKDNGEERTEAEFIVSLVNEDNDKENIIQLIAHVAKLFTEIGPEKFLRVIHYVIAHSEAPLAIIICCAFVIKEEVVGKLEDKSAFWPNRFVRAWVGASMLRTIPNGIIRDHYSHLVEHPDLIMEQLIMNSQIDLFRKMVELVKEQKKAYLSIKKLHSDGSLSKFNTDEFIEELEPYRINKLLIEYTFKVLELPAVRDELENDADDVSTLVRSVSRRNSITSVKSFLNASGESIVRKGSESSVVVKTKSSENVMPSYVSLPPGQWIQDKDALVCMCCKKEVFSMFNRRHHCRKCGRVICGMCSTHRSLIKGVTVRICNDCHQSIIDLQNADHRAKHGSFIMDDNKYRSPREMLYTRHNMRRHGFSPRSISSTALTNIDITDTSTNVLSMDIGVGALENCWRLSTDPERNEIIRHMFYYDDAPSITLAFSLTYFHSNSNECGNSLLDRVEYLADFLKPMKNGLPNAEVDYLLVIDIAKQIAYKAKEKFSFTNNDVDFARAEVYLSRLDLLGILVRSNYSHCLPSLSDGSKFREKIESLRDKLIREERLELARIVSSKAGLSNDPVFVAMGLHALEEGKYEEARRLFASCTKSGRSGSLSGTGLCYPLNEIMKILERIRLSVEKMGEMLDNIRDNDDLLKCPELKYMKECDISQKQIEEAIYYCDTYNAPLHCLQFLCRQQMWSKATDYVIKKNVSKEVFIDGLVAPAVSTGRFSSVKAEMLMREGINGWRTYYEALCTFLDKKRCYDDLIELQELNKDYLRAAGTLIRHFYLRGAQTYVDLEKRIPYLKRAQKHFVNLISQSENNASGDTEKYKKNLTLIKEQMEATKFLSDQMTLSHHQAGYGYVSRSGQPPTLFSTPDEIKDFCLTILFSRPNMSDGLQMLCPMMPLCHIYPERILPKAATWLLQNPNSVIQTKSVNAENLGIDSVLELCSHINSCYRLDSRKNDEVLISVLPVIPISVLQPQAINRFVKLLISDQKKIEAYIIVKDFKRAYANAVKLKYVDDVKRILELATRLDDKSGVIDFCTQWLRTNDEAADR